MFDKYKSKSITLRNSTHSKLTALSKKLVPGLDISIPQTIEKIVDLHLSNSEGSKLKGITDVNRNQKA